MFSCIYEWRMRDSGHVVVCKKKQFNVQKEMLALSGTQRHLGGPLYPNKLQKIVLWFAQAKLPDSLLRLHILGVVLFVCGQELAI